ncbi:MAG: NAD-dependent epimerase/dehydratase family protein [Deltaproteobacteria bacterium]|nr:NAD-dependent epimerase/dehydratase family protein [Deltaproteobacteria bacterium]
MAVRQKVKRLLFFSTIAVYGNSGGQVLKEGAPTKPITFNEKTKLEAEQIVLNAKDSLGQPIGTVLRFASVYGSRIKGNYRQLLESLAKGRFIPIGHGQNRRALVYDKDVARAAVLALEHPNAGGKIFNVSDGGFHTLNDIIRAMCEALGRPLPRISLPVAPVRYLASALEIAAKLMGRQPPIGRAIIEKYIEDIAVDSQLVQRGLGFQPHFDLRSGWRETVQEMRETGEL